MFFVYFFAIYRKKTAGAPRGQRLFEKKSELQTEDLRALSRYLFLSAASNTSVKATAFSTERRRKNRDGLLLCLPFDTD